MKFYINENKQLFFEGQELTQYDIHDSFVDFVVIKSFIVHKRKDKSKYLCVRLQSKTVKSYVYTLPIEVLGNTIR